MGRFGWHSGQAHAKGVNLTPSEEVEFSSPKKGDIMYDATANKLKVWTGSAWETVTSV